MALSKGDKNAFADALALTMDGMYEEFRLVASLMLYGFGSGILGKVSSVAVNDITLLDNIMPPQWFYEGLKLSVYDSDESTLDAGATNPITVTNVNLATRVITVSDGTSIDANDVLVLASGLNKAFHGLLAAVDDGTYVDTYFNIQRTAAGRSKWKSYVDSRSGTPVKYGDTVRRSVSGDVIQKALDQQRIRAGAARSVDQFISSLGVRRAYWNSLSPDRRFDTLIFDGGWEQLKFSNGDRVIPWFADELAPKFTIFGLHTGARPAGAGKKVDKVQDEEVLALYEALPPDWDNATGSELKQVYSSGDFKDSVGAFMKWYANFGTCRPNLHIRIDDLLGD